MVIVRQASRRGASGGLRSHLVCRSEAGYAANSTDALVLKMNPRTELRGDQITNVFGYARNMETKVRAIGSEQTQGMLVICSVKVLAQCREMHAACMQQC